MPITSPRMLISGPPELPGLIATSVWMNGRKSPVSRCLALTMPAVTVFSSPNGEPMAITHSPTRSRFTSPIFTGARPVTSIFTTATSVRLSAPTTFALNSRLSGKVTSNSSAPSTTWALVMIRPSALRMKPEPTPRGCASSDGPRSCLGVRGVMPGGTGMPKRLKNSSICSSGAPPAPGRTAAARSNVRILTTDGPTRSTRSVKSGRPRTLAAGVTGTTVCAEREGCSMSNAVPIAASASRGC
ncbi:hypothetical protein FQZ97_863090 [compost metagenome]